MTQRLAACMSLLVFAICLLIGGLEVDNPFTTTVLRALGAMGVTYLVGLMIGAMAQKMLDETFKSPTKLENSAAKPTAQDR